MIPEKLYGIVPIDEIHDIFWLEEFLRGACVYHFFHIFRCEPAKDVGRDSVDCLPSEKRGVIGAEI